MNTFRQYGYPSRFHLNGPGPDLFISYVGIFESTGDFLWRQVSNVYCLHAITSGAGVFVADGKEYPAKRGDVFMFHPGMHIDYFDAPETPWNYTWLRFEGTNAKWAVEQAGLKRNTPWARVAETDSFWNQLTALSERYESERYGPTYPVSAAWAVIDSLSTRQQVTAPIQLADACRMVIENQLEHAPSVEDLATRFAVSRTTLFRAFRAQYHMSPKEYIDMLRFEKARSLLERTNLTIKEIAVSVGFDNQDYFSTAYRKRFGYPPSKQRPEKLGKTLQSETNSPSSQDASV